VETHFYTQQWESAGVGPHEIVSSADLGGSSNYSKESRPPYEDYACFALKTEVAKVFMTTVIDHELVDPNPKDYEK